MAFLEDGARAALPRRRSSAKCCERRAVFPALKLLLGGLMLAIAKRLPPTPSSGPLGQKSARG